MITLKDELKELELIQKELEQARADTKRLWKAEQETLKRIKDLKIEELQESMLEDEEDYYEDR